MILFLALRNLFLLRKRYAIMIIAIALGFMLITVLTALSNGAIIVIKEKAARFFSGEISIIQFSEEDTRFFENPDEIVDYIKKSPLPVQNISPRTIGYYTDANLIFFGGKYAELKRTIGLDFATEMNQISKLPIVEGSVQSMLEPNSENGIILSSAICGYLNAKIGDDITIQTQLSGGHYNTATFILKAIFDEQNFFGYASYMHRETLNTLLNYDKNAATDIAVYAKKGKNITALAENIRLYLEKSYKVLPQITTRQDYKTAWHSHRKGNSVLAVISTDSQLDQVKDLLDAFLMATYFILLVFLIITLIGILNTYKVLVYERTKEIGAMRAMGMHKNQVRLLFLTEAFFLAIFSAFCGFIIANVTLFTFHAFNLKDFILISMFTEQGRLQFDITIKQTIINGLLIIVTVLLAAFQPSSRACNIQPVDALRN